MRLSSFSSCSSFLRLSPFFWGRQDWDKTVSIFHLQDETEMRLLSERLRQDQKSHCLLLQDQDRNHLLMKKMIEYWINPITHLKGGGLNLSSSLLQQMRPECKFLFSVWCMKLSFHIPVGGFKKTKYGILISWQCFLITLGIRIHQKKFQFSSLTGRPPTGSLHYTKEIPENTMENFESQYFVKTLNLFTSSLMALVCIPEVLTHLLTPILTYIIWHTSDGIGVE